MADSMDKQERRDHRLIARCPICKEKIQDQDAPVYAAAQTYHDTCYQEVTA